MRKDKKELLKELLCEFLASFFVQIIGCTVTTNFGDIQHALAWGGAVAAVTQAFRVVSGAHINPCITIAAMILQVVELAVGFLYILFQLIGTGCGFGVAYAFFLYNEYKQDELCVCLVRLEPWWKSFALEIFMTGAWVLAMCASWNYANVNLLESIALRIGLVVGICHLVGGAQTGCSMNPFRALWPALAANNWHWAFIPLAVPLVTAILIAICWRFLYIWGRERAYYLPRTE